MKQDNEHRPAYLRLYERLRGEITVQGAEQIDALFSMTPYYWRTSETDRAKLNGLTSLATAYDFDILLYRKDSRI